MTIELGFHLLAFGLLLGAVIVFVFLTDRTRRGHFDLLNPVLVMALLYASFNGLVLLSPEWRRHPAAGSFAFLGVMGLAGILLGVAGASWASQRITPGPGSSLVSRPVLLRYSLLLTIFSLAMLMLMLVRHLGFDGLLQADSYQRAKATRGLLTGFSFLLPIGAGYTIALLLERRGKLALALAAITMFALCVHFYLSASRGQLLHSSLLALFTYHFCVRRIRNRHILLLGAFLFMLMVFTGTLRAGIGGEGRDIASTMSVEAVLKNASLERIEPYKSGVRNLELIGRGPPEGQFLWGASLLHFLPYLAPRILNLWDRPQMLDAWYVWSHDPWTAQAGGAWGFSPLVDAYFNFAAVGPFLWFSIFTFALALFHWMALRHPPFSRLRLLDCALAVTMIEVHRISISGYLKNYIFVFLLGAFLFLTGCRLLSGSPGREAQ